MSTSSLLIQGRAKSQAPHCGAPHSNPGQPEWVLWPTVCHRNRHFSGLLRFHPFGAVLLFYCFPSSVIKRMKNEPDRSLKFRQRCICLRHRTTSREVAGSIPDGVIGIFHWHKPSGRTMAPGVDSASNRNEYQECFQRSKGGRFVGLTIILHICADCHEIWEPIPPGTLWACPGPYRVCFAFTRIIAVDCNTALDFPVYLFPAKKYVNTFLKKIEDFQTHYIRAGELFLRALAINYSIITIIGDAYYNFVINIH